MLKMKRYWNSKRRYNAWSNISKGTEVVYREIKISLEARVVMIDSGEIKLNLIIESEFMIWLKRRGGVCNNNHLNKRAANTHFLISTRTNRRTLLCLRRRSKNYNKEKIWERRSIRSSWDKLIICYVFCKQRFACMRIKPHIWRSLRIYNRRTVYFQNGFLRLAQRYNFCIV